jgi:hypothetical protein
MTERPAESKDACACRARGQIGSSRRLANAGVHGMIDYEVDNVAASSRNG